MTALATLEHVNGAPPNGAALAPRPQTVSPLELTYQQMWEFSATIAESRMFAGIDTASKAMTLMMLAQCDRIHPVLALKRYHIIEGRPSLKAQTLYAEFLARGGQVRILRTDAEEARAIFSHPKLQPDGVELAVTWEECEQTYAKGENGTKKNWRNSRPDMLWARLVARGTRRVDPGIETGIPTCEELDDILSWERPSLEADPLVPRPIVQAHAGPLPPVAGDVVVPGGPADREFDPRAIHQVVQGACDKLGIDYADALSQLRNRAVQLGLWTKAVPVKRPGIIEMLGSIYKSDRDWMRTEIAALTAAPAKAKEPAPPADPQPAPQPAPDPLPVAPAPPPRNGCPLRNGVALHEWARATGQAEGVDLVKHLATFGAELGYPTSLKFWRDEQIERGYHECQRHLEDLQGKVPF